MTLATSKLFIRNSTCHPARRLIRPWTCRRGQARGGSKGWRQRIETIFLGLALSSAQLACGGTPQMARWASQETGCIEDGIVISSVRRAEESSSYFATCSNGSVYECESSGRYVDGISTSCEALEVVDRSGSAQSGKVAGTGTIAISSWTPIQFETCPVTALMPFVPHEVPTALVGGIKSTEVAESGNDEWRATVGCSVVELPEGRSLFEDPDEILRAAAELGAQNVGGVITSFQLAENRKRAHVVIDLPGQGTILERLWLTPNTVVMALVLPRERFGNEELVKFFGGVEVGQ